MPSKKRKAVDVPEVQPPTKKRLVESVKQEYSLPQPKSTKHRHPDEPSYLAWLNTLKYDAPVLATIKATNVFGEFNEKNVANNYGKHYGVCLRQLVDSNTIPHFDYTAPDGTVIQFTISFPLQVFRAIVATFTGMDPESETVTETIKQRLHYLFTANKFRRLWIARYEVNDGWPNTIVVGIYPLEYDGPIIEAPSPVIRLASVPVTEPIIHSAPPKENAPKLPKEEQLALGRISVDTSPPPPAPVPDDDVIIISPSDIHNARLQRLLDDLKYGFTHRSVIEAFVRHLSLVQGCIYNIDVALWCIDKETVVFPRLELLKDPTPNDAPRVILLPIHRDDHWALMAMDVKAERVVLHKSQSRFAIPSYVRHFAKLVLAKIQEAYGVQYDVPKLLQLVDHPDEPEYIARLKGPNCGIHVIFSMYSYFHAGDVTETNMDVCKDIQRARHVLQQHVSSMSTSDVIKAINDF